MWVLEVVVGHLVTGKGSVNPSHPLTVVEVGDDDDQDINAPPPTPLPPSHTPTVTPAHSRLLTLLSATKGCNDSGASILLAPARSLCNYLVLRRREGRERREMGEKRDIERKKNRERKKEKRK